MKTTITEQEMLAYAKEGARQELKTILAVFPDLREDAVPDIRKRISAAKWRAKVKATKKPRSEKKSGTHWTQSPSGRRKIARAMKAAWKRRKEAAA